MTIRAIILLLLVLIAPGNLLRADDRLAAAPFLRPKPRVLVLHSYHSGFTWTDNITAGLRSALADYADRIDLNIEYMDTRRIYSEAYFETLKAVYRLKYTGKKIDVMICTDDQALDFALNHARELFDEIPIVFCSVSGYEPSLRRGRQLTGLLESIDIKDTLDIALKFHPQTRQVAVITDMTRTGQALKAKALKIFNQYPEWLHFTYLEDLTIEELRRRVATLPEDTIIFLFIFSRDKAGRVFSHEYNLKTLYPHARVPIYGVWRFYLGHGIVGGKLTSGQAEGRMAGQMALRILGGERASDIPTVKSPVQFMFDHRELKRFQISEASIPAGSLIVHKPSSVYQKFKHLIWSVSAVIVLLLALVVFLIVSIGRRRQVEAALRESETKFFKLFDASPIWMVLTTLADGQYIEANRAFYEMTGYTHDEVLHRSSTDLGLWINPEDRARVMQRLEKQGRLNSYPIRFRMKNGDIRDFLWSAAVLDISGERLVLSGLVDITMHIKAERALAESEKRFRDLAELLPETIFEMNVDGNLTFANQQAFEQFLYSPEDFGRGLSAFDMIAPEDRRRAAENAAGILAGEPLGLREYRAQRKDGSTFPVLVRSTAVQREGKVVGLRGFMIDVSEKKRLEAQLQQAQKLESLGTLAGGVAHDFNNLLMGIQGRTSLMMMDTELFHPHQEHLREIEKYVRSAADLTKQLLGFARGGKYEVKPTDLNDLITQNSRMFGRTKKEITIHRKFEKQLWPVEVDRSQIDQVLLNIYVNAWQAMPRGGELYLQTENVELDYNTASHFGVNPGKFVKITISDTGIGMADSTLKRVFDPFFSTKSKERGTGLGLASAYGIVQNHDGAISASSSPGQGATFTIFLPASDKTAADECAPGREIVHGTETILLVDDEQMILKVGQGMLEKIGYRVLTAESGIEALAVYADERDTTDLVILDMVMPDMSGGETYDQLKIIDPFVKVLLSSGYSINGQATQILNRGCDGFIQKPFDMTSLSRKVREILDRQQLRAIDAGS